MIDACTLAPDRIGAHVITACCQAHDAAYDVARTMAEKLAADHALGQCIADMGGWLMDATGIVYAAATAVFGTAFWLAARWRRRRPTASPDPSTPAAASGLFHARSTEMEDPTPTRFDAGSAKRLAAAHPLIQRVMNEARKTIAFQVLDSQRGRVAQEAAFRKGNSKAHFGQSAHNWTPSVAVDIAPVPLDWNDRKAFIALSKVILPIAKTMGVPLRWGGDWNGNNVLTDEKLSDLPHYELHPWRDFAKSCKPFGE